METSRMNTVAFGLSETGRRREANEDAFWIDQEAGLFVIADGLGGHAAGDVASHTAVEVARQHVARNQPLLEDSEGSEGGRFAVQVLVDGAIKEASARLYERACGDPGCAGMGTTLTLALLWNGRLFVGHVGDSRLYLLRSGLLQRLTIDHTVADELVRQGDLTPAEARQSPLSHALTRCVGGQPSVLVETFSLDLLPGDTFLLCTDGLHRYLTEEELAEHLGRDDLGGAPDALAGLAVRRGGEDDLTAIAFRVTPGSGDSRAAAGRTRVQARLAALAGVPLLQGLSLTRLARVLDAMEVRRYEAGEVLVEPDDALDGMYVLVDGDVEGLGTTPGASHGERFLPQAGSATRELRANAPSEVLFLGQDAFTRLVRRLPRLGCRLLWGLVTDPSERRGAHPLP